MLNFLIDNKCGVVKNEKTTLEIIEKYLNLSFTENKPISLYMVADFRFFDSLIEILPLLKQLFDKDLLKRFSIIISSRNAINPKEFLFKLKSDAISLNKNDFFILNLLNKSGVLQFRVNYKDNINTLLYLIKYNQNVYSFTGNTSFSPNDHFFNSINFLSPTYTPHNKKSIHFLLFSKLWKISESRINNLKVITYLKIYANAEVINLNPRNFIAVILKSISKDYLVKNISTDLSQIAEYKNMGYYSCIEKMQKYGSVIFANSIGLSELYISSMIIKFYFEKNKKSLVICSKESEQTWEQNFIKTGLKKSFARFINRSELQKNSFSSESITDIDLVIIDNAEYFSISKERNNRKKHIETILLNNPDAHILMISKNIINDSLYDLITIYNMFSRGKYKKILKNDGIDNEVTNLIDDIEKKNISNKTIESIKKILNTFMVKIEWTNLDSFVDPLQQDLNKPSITTVKYAYDHDISMKIYEKLIPAIFEFKFEYCKLKFNGYHEDENLTNWYKWRLCRTIESSLIAFTESLKKLIIKTEITLQLISHDTHNNNINQFFTEDQIINIKNSFEQVNNEQRKIIVEGLNSDIAILNNLLLSSQSIKYLENRDEKVTNLLKILNTESKPTVIFSESDDTIAYLKRRLIEYGNLKSATISGETTGIDGDDILTRENTSIEEICKEFEQGLYNILITNDSIAEEIKLPRAKVIINFDMPINPSSLSKRNRIASAQPNSNKTKIYNFQSDRRIDKEILLFETLKIPLHELIAYYGIDFILWSLDEKHINEISESHTGDFYLLTKEYKDFFAKKNTDEIKSKFTPSLSKEDITLREFIKFLNISEETLKLSISNFKRPIYTSLFGHNDNFFVIYKTSTGIKTTKNLEFSNLRTDYAINETTISDIEQSIKNSLLSEDDGDFHFIIGIIKYCKA